MDSRRLYSHPSAAETADQDIHIDVEDFWAVQILLNKSAGTLTLNIFAYIELSDGGTGQEYNIFTAAAIANDTPVVELIAPGGTINAIPGNRLRLNFDVTTTATYTCDVVGR